MRATIIEYLNNESYDYVEVWNAFANNTGRDTVYYMSDADDVLSHLSPSELIELGSNGFSTSNDYIFGSDSIDEWRVRDLICDYADEIAEDIEDNMSDYEYYITLPMESAFEMSDAEKEIYNKIMNERMTANDTTQNEKDGK
jgi:hypothetical protein